MSDATLRRLSLEQLLNYVVNPDDPVTDPIMKTTTKPAAGIVLHNELMDTFVDLDLPIGECRVIHSGERPPGYDWRLSVRFSVPEGCRNASASTAFAQGNPYVEVVFVATSFTHVTKLVNSVLLKNPAIDLSTKDLSAGFPRQVLQVEITNLRPSR